MSSRAAASRAHRGVGRGHPDRRHTLVTPLTRESGQAAFEVDGEASAALSEVVIHGAGAAALSVQGGADVELVNATVSTTHGPAVTVVRARVRVRGGDFSGDRMPGVEVGERGVAELDRVSLRGFTTGLIWRAGASGTADRCTVTGTSGDAVLVQTGALGEPSPDFRRTARYR